MDKKAPLSIFEFYKKNFSDFWGPLHRKKDEIPYILYSMKPIFYPYFSKFYLDLCGKLIFGLKSPDFLFFYRPRGYFMSFLQATAVRDLTKFVYFRKS